MPQQKLAQRGGRKNSTPSTAVPMEGIRSIDKRYFSSSLLVLYPRSLSRTPQGKTNRGELSCPSSLLTLMPVVSVACSQQTKR